MIDGQQEPIIMDFGLARRTNKRGLAAHAEAAS